ncbi:MAG: PEGA domain-containing protein [Muribaculaceae bacterium]|nr:PEGA domain-containing protein [Muribaculaceae bacterium]
MTARQILLSFIFVLAGLAAFGQELVVESFVQSSDPVPGYRMVRDRHDNPAAIVKVLIPIKGLEFEGDVLKSEEGTGEYTVYMPEGTKRLRVKAPGYYPRMVEFGAENACIVALKGAKLYELRLRGGGGQAGGGGAVARANYVIFKISPADAQLRIDGKLYPVEAGGAARAYLSTGTHSYSVEAPGYKTAGGSFVIEAQKKTQLNVSLVSRLVKVVLSCPTMGVKFYVNDAPADSYEVDLIPGMYRVEARRNGYATEARTLEVAEGRRMDFAFPALRRLTGNLNVDVSPIGAQIYVDDELRGTSPELIRDLTAGTHTVRIHAEGCEDMVRQVEISNSQTSTLSGSLNKAQNATQPGVGGKVPELDLVVSTPKGIKIYPKGSRVKLGSDETVIGLGLDMPDGSFTVFLAGYALNPVSKKQAVSRYGKAYLPSSEQLTALFADMDAVDRTTQTMFGWKIPRGSYWNNTVVGNSGTPDDKTNYLLAVLYSGKKDEQSIKSEIKPDPMWNTSKVKVYDGPMDTWGYIYAREAGYRPKWRDMAVQGVVTADGNEVGLRDIKGSLEPEERLMTKAEADSINKWLDSVNKSLREAGGETIQKGMPYKVEVYGSSRQAYYFGENAGLRTMKAGEKALVRPLLNNISDIKGRTEPRNLDLMTAHNGEYRFFSQRSWARLPKAKRKEYPIVGFVVEGQDSWHVIGEVVYNSDRITVVPWFKKTLMSYEAEREIARNFEAINSALGAFGLPKFDLNTSYWSNQDGKAVVFAPGTDGVTRSYRVPTDRDYRAKSRQEVMLWPKKGTGGRLLKLKQPQTDKDSVRLEYIPDGGIYYMSEALWKHLPAKEKSRWRRKYK